MSLETIVIILVIGGIAGWLAGVVFQGAGFGIAFNILIGIIGGFVGTWVLGELHVKMPGGAFISAVLTSFVGASILVLFIILLRRAFWPRRPL
jgi:uncharacterized membrane protein YeaQ/YmgE (transglycosylase-associated protein family)